MSMVPISDHAGIKKMGPDTKQPKILSSLSWKNSLVQTMPVSSCLHGTVYFKLLIKIQCKKNVFRNKLSILKTVRNRRVV